MIRNRIKQGRTAWTGWKPLFVLLGAGLGFGRLPAQEPGVGVHFGSDYATSQYEAFGDWLGRDVLYRVVFMEKKSWASISDPGFLHITSAWANSLPGRTDVISMPLLPDSETGGFAVIANGSRDTYFRTFAANVVAAGVADKVIIRLAWEANGNWYKWSFLQNTAGFKSAFRRAVQVMRSAAPQLRFEFNISNLASRGPTGAKWSDGYPGNDVVDVISMDIYDHWNTWDRMMNGDAGLAEMRAFAIANNKPEAYAEWSCSTTPNGHGDNPTFVRNMATWMRARPGKVLYQAYWNTTGGANAMVYGSSTILVPNTAAEYRRQFGPAPATPPTISTIANRTIAAGADTGPIPFTIGDAETPAANLALSATVSNQTLTPVAQVTFGGSGANRMVTVKPAANQSGTSTISLKVSDGQLSTTTSFVLTVTPPVPAVSAPTISAISDRSIPVNGNTGSIAFTIGDAQTPASSLTLTKNASDLSLIPLANITLGGSGANRTVTVKLVTNKTGSSTIWIKVSDGQLTAVTSFVVNVTASLVAVDIGSPAIAGSYAVSGTTITMRAGGYDIYNLDDEFTFAQRTLPGDAELTVRVASLTAAHDWTKAGPMFRSSLASNAAFAAVFVTPAKGVVLQWRASNGGACSSSVARPGAAPQWLRLVRSADSFFAFSSDDGVNWEIVDSVDVDLPDTALAGLAVTSHATTTATTATFDGLAID